MLKKSPDRAQKGRHSRDGYLSADLSALKGAVIGVYLNPGNGGFEIIVCISRPRRFGKTFAAQMLTAYYYHTCDSHKLFDDKIMKIKRSKSALRIKQGGEHFLTPGDGY